MKLTILVTALGLAGCDVSTIVAREYEDCDAADTCEAGVASCEAVKDGEPCSEPSDLGGGELLVGKCAKGVCTLFCACTP